MAESGEATPTPTPPEFVPRDEGLRCLHCGYNLTGLADERCPECGEAFDIDALREAMCGKAAPVPRWDDDSAWWPVAFADTCLATWMSPSEFGREFPTRHVRTSGLRFRLLCLATALIVFGGLCMIVPGLSGGRVSDVWVAWAVPPGVMVGAIVCEMVLALVFHLCLRRKGMRSGAGGLEGYVSWRGLVGFFRSFLLVSAVLITPCLATTLALVRGPHADLFAILSWVAIVVAIIFWWHNLCRAALAASWPGPGRVVACILVPFVAALAIFVGFVASFCCGLALFTIFEARF